MHRLISDVLNEPPRMPRTLARAIGPAQLVSLAGAVRDREVREPPRANTEVLRSAPPPGGERR